jgi:hypothetical protein
VAHAAEPRRRVYRGEHLEKPSALSTSPEAIYNEIGYKVNIVRVIRSSPLAGLCYDTPSVEAMTFPGICLIKSLALGHTSFIRKNFRINSL